MWYRSSGPYPDSVEKAVEILDRVCHQGFGLVFNLQTNETEDLQAVTDEGCADKITLDNPDPSDYTRYLETAERLAQYIDSLPTYHGRPTYLLVALNDDGRITVSEVRPDNLDPVFAPAFT